MLSAAGRMRGHGVLCIWFLFHYDYHLIGTNSLFHGEEHELPFSNDPIMLGILVACKKNTIGWLT